MAKAHYHYDPETLSFKKVKKGFKYRLKQILVYLVPSLVFGSVIAYLLWSYADSPQLKSAKQENSRLVMQIDLMNQQMDQFSEILDEVQQRDEGIYRVIFEADPIPSSIRKAGFGGVNRYEHLENMQNAELVISTRKKLDVLTKELYIQTKSFDEIVELARNKEKMLHSIPAIMPISNRDLKRTASGWGYRIHPIEKIRKFHYGMDFTSPIGTDIYATGDGRVVKVIKSRRGYGNYIVIDHGFGYQTLYGHLSGFNVKVGQKITRGHVIGYVGNTGDSTGPHLHYEVHYKNRPVNPKDFYYQDLTPEQYDEMISISTNTGQTFD
ncbi:M23 family metallopeptidase [Saccharicrinis sp. FJH2]|uniref:M23 family metallopeptidase n=1 Tax=unclassified Saccharicrinis TaxID=2646859 RepID=UPI0035D3EA62